MNIMKFTAFMAAIFMPLPWLEAILKHFNNREVRQSMANIDVEYAWLCALPDRRYGN